MPEHIIDFTAMRVGTVTMRDRHGKAICKIARCPKCGRRGELHAAVDLPGAVVDTYYHTADDLGFARAIREHCTVVVREKPKKERAGG